MDITSFFNTFITMMLNGVRSSFSLLSQIKFLGTNLLVYLLTLTTLSVVISLLLTVKRSSSLKSRERKKIKDE